MITGILVAAGNSTRFGANKLQHRLDSGAGVAEQAARQLIAAVPSSLAVIKPGDTQLRALFEQLGLGVVECAHSVHGMAASIACGVKTNSSAEGWVIALADMPWIQAATIFALVQHVRAGAEIAVPLHGGGYGHPVVFAAGFGKQLIALNGDRGARDILAASKRKILRMPTTDKGVLADIDIPTDLVQQDLYGLGEVN